MIALIRPANTPLQPAYESFWSAPVGFEVAGHSLIDFSLRTPVNDGHKALFFIVVAVRLGCVGRGRVLVEAIQPGP